jgi:hypothetical protein
LVTERPSAPIPGAFLLLAALGGCGAVLGIDEKHYESAGDGGGASDAVSIEEGSPTPGPDASSFEEVSPRAPDASSFEDAACAAPCPVCQACDPSRGCVPAPAGGVCALPHAKASCDGFGGCAIVSCSPGYLDCTADPGCETARTLAQCASCSTVCAPSHVVHAICNPDGTCGYDMCAAFGGGPELYLDCDGNAANGCESSPDAIDTCGACGTACPVRCAKTAMSYQCKSQ